MALIIDDTTTVEDLAEAVRNLSGLLASERDLNARAKLRAEQDELLDAWVARMRVEH